MASSIPTSVLCVCLGNICRSPTAEGMFKTMLKQHQLSIYVDSAGTSAHHQGEAPDARSQQHAKKRNLDLSTIKSRQLTKDDFLNFDLILAMDNNNLQNIESLKHQVIRDYSARGLNPNLAEVALFSLHDDLHPNKPLPDPYYGGNNGFELVLDQCASSINGWITHWKTLSE